MPAQPTHIVLQAYGNTVIKQECVFALITLSRIYQYLPLPDINIHIYTDEPEFFRSFNSNLPLQYHALDSEMLQRWKGEINFVHRVKIEILRDMTSREKSDMLYLDSDILFLKPVDELLAGIGDGKLYMHICEGVIKDKDNPIFAKLTGYLNSAQINVNNREVEIPADAAMWNAGVLGFKPGLVPLDEVLQFTDVVYKEFPKHIVEQFAFSLYLAKHTEHIRAASSYILHYWNLKELRTVLTSFFSHFENANWNDLILYSDLIDVPAYMQQKANFYQNRSIAGKIKKDKWIPVIPDWDLAVQQL